MSSAGTRRVLIVCQLDEFANGVRPIAIARFLQSRGHAVELVDTYRLSRVAGRGGPFLTKLPGPDATRIALFATEAASLLTRRWGFGRRNLSYCLIVAQIWLRQRILGRRLARKRFDLLICEHPHDAGVLAVPSRATTLYDCPTPYTDELFFEGKLTERQRERFRAHEASLFERADNLAFWWQSYAQYVLEHYDISGQNLLILNYGCTPAEHRAQFADPPRIAYIGSLSSRFIDLPLLARLSQLYPHIDVYGGPPPSPELGLNYRGYAEPDVLRNYQLGLITCTRDELRRSGFSAKHLEYLAYGLPVLVPAWRRGLDLLRGSVPYEERTLASIVEGFRDQAAWQQVSDEAYGQAERLRWEQTLEPLDLLLS
jgi:hypothetical protein